MSRGRAQRRLVTRVERSGDRWSRSRRPDRLVVEEPLTIQLDGTVVSTTMRTPGHDYELAAGFCFTEGLLAGAPITGIRYCADASALDSQFNVVTVETGGVAPPPTARLVTTSSSCGWCGSEQIDELCRRLSPLPPAPEPDPDVVLGVIDRVRDAQALFAQTGAIHAAAAFDDDGTPTLVREDVGRHNAVDKVVGALVLERRDTVPGAGLGLFVSGRASIEMVHKAWAAGFHSLVAVSAPTALAVEAAERGGLHLIGFARGDGYNLY